MQVKVTKDAPTKVIMTIIPSEKEMNAIKHHTLGHFRAKVKLPGFRVGKAPLELVEKNVDQTALQTEFLEEAINQLYPQAIDAEGLKPVERPEISIKKFVPFSHLEFEAKVTVIGEIQIGDYKNMRLKKPTVNVTADDVSQVIKSLQTRLADRVPVERASKTGDELLIDFEGTNAKGEPIKGVEGKDYPLILGSNAFVPGFESNLIGLKVGQTKSFTLQFPKDYTLKTLAGQNVHFMVKVNKVYEVTLPKVDDAFGAKAGPFKTLKALKDDIKKQLIIERERQAGLHYESELVRRLTAKSVVEVPDVLIEGQIERMLTDLKQNLAHRGQTFEEFLQAEGKTKKQYRQEILWPQAEERVKGSLILLAVAEDEKLEIAPEELEAHLQTLKAQYQDEAMRAELDKPEARREIAMRMLSEKTVAKLVAYADD